MFKKILILPILFGFAFCLADEPQQEVIQGGIKYNEATARIEAFKDVERKIDKKTFKNHLKDPNRKENLENIYKNNYSIRFERILCPFYYKTTLFSYAVTYYDDPSRVYYYNIFGSLMKFEISEDGEFPKRTFSYSRYGNLLTVNFDIDGNEQFMYEENGKLAAHWLGENYEGKYSKILKLTRGEKINKNDKNNKKKQKELKKLLELKEENIEK